MLPGNVVGKIKLMLDEMFLLEQMLVGIDRNMVSSKHHIYVMVLHSFSITGDQKAVTC